MARLLLILLLLVPAACTSSPARTAAPAASPQAPPASTSALSTPESGLGAPARGWPPPAGVSTVLTDPHGRVDAFIVTMTPRTLAEAIALVSGYLPADATAGRPRPVEGIEATRCLIVEFTSPTLGARLGDTRAMAVFQTAAAVVMDTRKITHAVVASPVSGLPEAC